MAIHFSAILPRNQSNMEFSAGQDANNKEEGNGNNSGSSNNNNVRPVEPVEVVNVSDIDEEDDEGLEEGSDDSVVILHEFVCID